MTLFPESHAFAVCLRYQAYLCEPAEAEQLYHKAIKLHDKLPPCQGYAYCLFNLGNLYQESNRVGEAEQIYERALQLYAQLPPCQDYADCLYNLGMLYYSSQRVGEAEQTYERALQLYA